MWIWSNGLRPLSLHENRIISIDMLMILFTLE